MDNEIRTKRAELRKFLLVECHMEGMAFIGVLDRSDAYALAAHVVECGEGVEVGESPPDANGHAAGIYKDCGDDWYCKDALEMKQLGVEAT